MNKQEFLTELEDVLQRDEPCLETDNMNEYEEWDSLSKMAVLAFFDKHFGIKIALNELKEVNLVSDLIRLSGGKISD